MKLRIWIGLITVYIAWGSTYLAIRFAVETMPPFLMAATRFLVAGAILYIWRRLAGDPSPLRLEWRSAAIVGFFLLLGGNGAVVWAEQRVASGIAALVVGSAPLWMVLIDAFSPIKSLKAKPVNSEAGDFGWVTYIGVVVGFLGIGLLVAPADLIGGAQDIDLLGMGALALAAFLWATGSLYNRGAKLPASPMLASGMQMLAGGAGLLVLGTLTGEWGRLDLAAISMPSILGLGYLIVFGSLIGFAAYSWLLRSAPTPLVSTYAYVNPLIAIFLGNILAQEPLTPRILLSAGIILGAVALINFARSPKPRPMPAVISSGED